MLRPACGLRDERSGQLRSDCVLRPACGLRDERSGQLRSDCVLGLHAAFWVPRNLPNVPLAKLGS